jgi:(S)-2-hydroxyglutarate dehydrogenase
MIAADPPSECDVVIVGAGIVGLAVARELSSRHDGMRVVVLEREANIGAHQTSHSSGVIHAGIYYAPGSLKARLCVEGARDLYAYCDQRGIPTKRSGKLIVATREDELPGLDELERRGRENQVPDLARLGPDELREVEPNAAGLAALHSPATGVVDFRLVAASFGAELVERGGSIVTGCAVKDVAASGSGGVEARHARGVTRARAAVLCAGAWSDRLAVRAGADPEPRIVPFRGGYLKLRPEKRHLVRAAIYPVPDPDLPFLGTHFTTTIDGDVLLGPSALMVGARDAYALRRVRPRDLGQTLAWPGTWRLMARQWRYGLSEIRWAASNAAFVRELQRFVPSLTPGDVVAGPSGIRAQALARDGKLVDDFVVSQTEGALHVRNAPSPAATSSLALGRLIADRAEAELDLLGG